MNMQANLDNNNNNHNDSAAVYFKNRLNELLANDGVTDYSVLYAHTLWNENNGNIEAYTIWDRIAKEAKCFYYIENCKDVPPTHHIKRDASEDEINLALDWIESNVSYRFMEKAIGHTFKVGNSRKVKKDTLVKLLAYQEGGYDNRYKNYVSAKVLVEVVETGDRHWISPNCLKQWVKGIREIRLF